MTPRKTVDLEAARQPIDPLQRGRGITPRKTELARRRTVAAPNGPASMRPRHYAAENVTLAPLPGHSPPGKLQ